jgi:hypothetical protein
MAPGSRVPPVVFDEAVRQRRARGLLDVVVLVALYQAYGLVQGVVPANHSVAELNAERMVEVERWLHLQPEFTLNHLVAAHGWLAQACDYWYTCLHFSVTIAVALWLLWRHHSRARHLLTPLYTATALALVCFWLVPLAPPRLFTGNLFVDTVVDFHTWGGWGSGAVDAVANQYAALPSLHMAWSLWCAIAASQCARSRLVRRGAWLYPAGTVFVILGTGNHWLLDAVAGALILAVGFAAPRAAHRARRLISGSTPGTTDPAGGGMVPVDRGAPRPSQVDVSPGQVHSPPPAHA